MLPAIILNPVPTGFNTSFGGNCLIAEMVVASPLPNSGRFGVTFASGLENPVRIARPPPSKTPSVPGTLDRKGLVLGFFSSDMGHLRSELQLYFTLYSIVKYVDGRGVLQFENVSMG